MGEFAPELIYKPSCTTQFFAQSRPVSFAARPWFRLMAHRSQKDRRSIAWWRHATAKGKGPAASPQGWPGSFFWGMKGCPACLEAIRQAQLPSVR